MLANFILKVDPSTKSLVLTTGAIEQGFNETIRVFVLVR